MVVVSLEREGSETQGGGDDEDGASDTVPGGRSGFQHEQPPKKGASSGGATRGGRGDGPRSHTEVNQKLAIRARGGLSLLERDSVASLLPRLPVLAHGPAGQGMEPAAHLRRCGEPA